MDLDSVLEEYSLTDFAAGIGGCQNQNPMHCCEYNVTVFDEKDEADLVIESGGRIVRIHHSSLNESRSNVLVQLCDLKVLQDDGWALRTLLARLRERRSEIFKDSVKNCLLDSLFCNARAFDGLRSSDALAPAWLKCAAFYLADAICLSNGSRPSPAHMLGDLRALGRSRINEKLAVVNACVGAERASPSLLKRMSISTMQLSDILEGNGHSKIIGRKCEHMIKRRPLTDCYFYLGYVGRGIMTASRDAIVGRAELIHGLKLALDLDNDKEKVADQCARLQKAASEVLATI